jgi:hypothetical protein
MYPSTEDLLSVRDGEPLDARTSEIIAADAGQLNEIERMRRMRGALRALPDVEPPADLWARIDAAERVTRYRSAASLKRAAGVGVAAAVAAVTIGYLALPRAATSPEPATAATPLTAPEPSASAAPDSGLRAPRVVPVSYTALVAESARLDGVLQQISYQRPLMDGTTALTIAGLEDRIGVIDEQLTFSLARRLPQPEREALWSERVDLMNALVHVRVAQAQPTGF